MKYGIQLPQVRMQLGSIKDDVEAYETMTRVAQTADTCGYETVWLSDHFHYGGFGPAVVPPSQDLMFECWTSTAALARDTTRVRIAQSVTCNGYRNPALLAKMASTVDVLSHGRLTLGIGAGDFEHEFRAYGYACPPVSERLRQLREAVQILLAMWTEDEATYAGTSYQVRGAINQPKGVQHPHIPLLIGGTGEKVTLKMVAQYGDACEVPLGDTAWRSSEPGLGATPPSRGEGTHLTLIEHKYAVLKAHCEAVGRDYESIRRFAAVICIIGDTDEEARAAMPEEWKAQLTDVLDSALIGSPETIRQRIAAYEEAGVQEMRLVFPDVVQRESIRRFAKAFIA
jgi:F420-dependent oxidoreductase-like protein